jgi:RHS repeat-associated protein
MISAAYNRDGSMSNTSAVSIEFHPYHRMPIRVNGASLRYNSCGMRTRKSSRIYRGYGIAIVEAAQGEELCFVISPNGLVYMRAGGVSVPVTRNRQQSVCVCGDALVQYAPYGEFAASGTLPRRLYTGYEYDEEWGMYNAQKRLYAPDMRVFVSVDPKLQYASPYLYCMSDPFNSVDPTGEMSTGNIIDIILNAVLIIAEVVITVLTWGAASETLATNATELTNVTRVITGMRAGRNVRYARISEEIVRGPEESDISYFGRVSMRTRTIQADEEARIAPHEAREQELLRGRRDIKLKATGKLAGRSAGLMVTGGAAKLSAKAAAGEHISAANALDVMLLQPVIAILGAGVGAVTVRTAGYLAGELFKDVMNITSVRLASYSIGAASGALASGVTSAAVHRNDLNDSKTWENIGIGVAAAVGAAMITATAQTVMNRSAFEYDPMSDEEDELSPVNEIESYVH